MKKTAIYFYQCVGLGACLLLSACLGGSSAPAPVSPEPVVTLLKDVFPTSGEALKWSLRATNDTELKTYLEKAVVAQEQKVSLFVAVDTAPAVPMATATGTTSTSTAATPSQTTLQEMGVDEADLVKADGTYLYSIDPSPDGLSRALLTRQKLNPSSPALVPSDAFKLGFSEDIQGTSLYLDSDRQQVAAIGSQSSGWIYGKFAVSATDWFKPTSWRNGASEVLLVQAPSDGSLKQTRHIKLGGHLIGSRRIGSTLYMVLRSYPQTVASITSTAKAADYLPTISVDGAGEQPLVDPAACLLQTGNSSTSADLITLVAIGLATDKHTHAARCFTGGTEAFFMSEQNVYLATTRTGYTVSDSVPSYSVDTTTDIHKFSLQGLNMAYRGSGNVKGHLGFDQNRKSFRMGEFNGALHVITETRSNWFFPRVIPTPIVVPVAGGAPVSTIAPIISSESTESPGRLTVLQENQGLLSVVGELPNAKRPEPLGKPGERLYASRFLGSKCYLVTYRLTDPLYVLDLADPKDLKIAGELEISGYSDYLFPISDSLLLGVGKDAVDDGGLGDGRSAWYQGVKVSLIDISQPSKPLEADRLIIGKRGTDATVLQDHHGIAIQTLNGVAKVAMPVKVHQTPTQYMYGKPSDLYGFTQNETAKFEVDLSQKKITAKTSLPSTMKPERWIGNDRSVIYMDQVHYYQDGAWVSGSW
ncbi:MAG: beta-propeller domain-containing protein [Rhodoferax sp.]|nr:beta-propeller domain-containing protein [Rhodoferax sp.]